MVVFQFSKPFNDFRDEHPLNIYVKDSTLLISIVERPSIDCNDEQLLNIYDILFTLEKFHFSAFIEIKSLQPSNIELISSIVSVSINFISI